MSSMGRLRATAVWGTLVISKFMIMIMAMTVMTMMMVMVMIGNDKGNDDNDDDQGEVQSHPAMQWSTLVKRAP